MIKVTWFGGDYQGDEVPRRRDVPRDRQLHTVVCDEAEGAALFALLDPAFNPRASTLDGRTLNGGPFCRGRA
jgi:hypothetical protein